MFYKVIKDGKVIDVLDRLVFLKYQPKHNRMIFCDENEAQAIFSSDREHIWHEDTLYNIPVRGYDTVHVEEIDEYEYKQLKVLNCKSIPEVIDWYTEMLIEDGVIQTMRQFVESLKRLYRNGKITQNKVTILFKENKIAEEEKKYILSN